MGLGELLVDVRLLGLGDAGAEDLGLLDRQQGLAPHVLGQRRDVAVVDQVDAVELLVDVGGEVSASAISRAFAKAGRSVKPT